MGDSGEGLIDSEARIQERRDELQASRETARKHVKKNPENIRQLDSLNLARTQMTRQLEIVTHESRRRQITEAIADIDIRIAGLHAASATAS